MTLLGLLIFALVAFLAIWLVRQIPLGEPFRTIILAVVVIILLLVLLENVGMIGFLNTPVRVR